MIGGNAAVPGRVCVDIVVEGRVINDGNVAGVVYGVGIMIEQNAIGPV